MNVAQQRPEPSVTLLVVSAQQTDRVDAHRRSDERRGGLVAFDAVVVGAVLDHRGDRGLTEMAQFGGLDAVAEPQRQHVEVAKLDDVVDVHPVQAFVDPGLRGEPSVAGA
ncbi:hypothetical protein ABNF97_30160 [Plantactinospora sp. B6F1]|uniref:hypothetical protein n=1 Tax=Plantactinospora sp. B6F1 TaxID=3158971 RepID=UPI0032D90101